MRKEKQLKVLTYLQREDIHVDPQGNLWYEVKTQKLCRMRTPGLLPTGYSQYMLKTPEGEIVMVYKHVLAYLAKVRKVYSGQIDHIDRDKANDCFDNLRAVTPKQNVENSDKNVQHREPRLIRKNQIVAIRTLMQAGHSQASIARTLDLNRLSVRYVMKRIESGEELKYENPPRHWNCA